MKITSKKNAEGKPGYFASEKKRRLLVTAALFAIPLTVFAAAWIYYGTRMTVWTVMTVVCCLPACRAVVSLIMMLRCHPADEALYKDIQAHQGDLEMAYEMYMTFYDKSARIDAAAICGNVVAAYSSDPKIDAAYMEKEAQAIIRKNGYKVTVKIFTDLRPFLDRLDSLNEHRESLEADIRFTPDEQHPELSRNELIKNVIFAICL